jgi:hypothetical protein
VYDVSGRDRDGLSADLYDQPSLVVDVARQADDVSPAGQGGTHA